MKLIPEKVIVTVPNNFISFYILRGMTGIFMGRDMILGLQNVDRWTRYVFMKDVLLHTILVDPTPTQKLR